MKHWLLVGTIIIIAAVLLMRSRVSTRSTVSPAALPTVTADPLPASQPATSPTTLPAGAGLLSPQRTVPIPTH
jgi:hypothetical protein